MQCLETTIHLVLVVLLQVASLLLASANDSTEAKDALKVSLQSNETTQLEFENADLAAMLESNEEFAQEQIDKLSLVTRYTGTGYNLVRGNPEVTSIVEGLILALGQLTRSLVIPTPWERRPSTWGGGWMYQIKSNFT